MRVRKKRTLFAAAPIPPYVISPWPTSEVTSEGLELLLDCPVRPLASLFGVEWYIDGIKFRTLGPRVQQLDNGKCDCGI